MIWQYYISDRNHKKNLRFETFFTPNLSQGYFHAVRFHLSPPKVPDMSTEPGTVHRPRCLLLLWGDSAGTPEEMKQFLWNRDFVHTATGVKFTLLTSQSTDADQKLTSLPVQMCCTVWLCVKRREKVLEQVCFFDSSIFWGFPMKPFEWFIKGIWYLDFQFFLKM